jgi:hypothetical protein
MNKEGFRRFLQARKLSEGEIEQHVSLAEKFEGFLRGSVSEDLARSPTIEDARAFVAVLVQEETDTLENLLALARYGRFAENNEVYLAALELLDGGEVMGNLYEKLGKTVGEQKRDEVFEGIERPTWGTPNTQKSRLMQAVMERLERLVDAETCKQILSDSLRDLPDESYLEDRHRYAECGSFDEFLEMKREEFIAQLEQIKNGGGLFFNQEITDEVIAFVRDNPEISQAVRRGNVLYVTKIPYMTKEYLAETDEDKKRYYYCHCPWARESLKSGEARVPATFCQCSAGFHKKPWEVIFDQPLEAVVLESILKGDLRCRFAIHLPANRLRDENA